VRVDAELVRDIALRASGLLVSTLYGPPVYPPQPEGATETAYGGAEWPTSAGPDRYRRGIYTFLKRTAPYAMYNTFDAPSGEVCLAQREASNTPLQSLALLNDAVFLEAARHLGTQVAQHAGDDEDRVRQLFQRCLTRDPRPAELTSLLAFAARQRARLSHGELTARSLLGPSSASAEPAPDPAANAPELDEQAVWTIVARVVLNLDETITRN
jgi:hypothetical protein